MRKGSRKKNHDSGFDSDAKLLSTSLSTAQPSGRIVPPILAGGQYRNNDLPIIFLAGRGPLQKQTSCFISKVEETGNNNANKGEEHEQRKIISHVD